MKQLIVLCIHVQTGKTELNLHQLTSKPHHQGLVYFWAKQIQNIFFEHGNETAEMLDGWSEKLNLKNYKLYLSFDATNINTLFVTWLMQIFKQLLDEVFVISEIIKVKVTNRVRKKFWSPLVRWTSEVLVLLVQTPSLIVLGCRVNSKLWRMIMDMKNKPFFLGTTITYTALEVSIKYS